MKLINITKKHFGLVGSKAYSLAKMNNEISNNDINVPDAFVITTDIFNTFIVHNNIQNKIIDELKIIQKSNYDISAVTLSSYKIQSLFNEGVFPSDIQNTIIESYRSLNSNFVAVRSSSTSEDLNNASYAGQYDSLLYIDNCALIESIKTVFASLYNARAIIYRNAMNNTNTPVMAIIIQAMVLNDNGSSGVAFSLDIDDGNQDIIYISSTYGMCDMIVNGMVTPDEIKINKKDLTINEFTIGDKSEKMIQGNKIVSVESNDQEKLSISSKNLSQLAEKILTIEKHYNQPMDIEWVIDDRDTLYILQARPITSF